MNNPQISTSKKVPMEKLHPLIKKALASGKHVVIDVTGHSMQPMLYHRRDTVLLDLPTFPLKKYDLIFYKMDYGKYFLHRVIRINSNGTYECRGDNRHESENNIREDQVIGIVNSFVRNGKKVDCKSSKKYWLYVHTWKFLHPFKPLYKYFNCFLNAGKKGVKSK